MFLLFLPSSPFPPSHLFCLFPLYRQDAADLSQFLLPMLQIDPGLRCSAEEALQHEWLADVDKNVPIPLDTPPTSDEEDDDLRGADVASTEDEEDVDDLSDAEDSTGALEDSVPGGE